MMTMSKPIKRTAQVAALVALASLNLSAFGRVDDQWDCENVWCPIFESLCIIQQGTYLGCSWTGTECNDRGCQLPG